MPELRTAQTNFSSGELSPRMRGRVDLKQYYQSASSLSNVLLYPQGGCYVRPGMAFDAELIGNLSEVDLTAGGVAVTTPEGGTPANLIDGDRSTSSVSGAISTTDPFVLVHIDLGAATDVSFIDTIEFKLSGLSTDEFRWQSSTDDISFSDFGSPLESIDTNTTDRRASDSVNARYWRLAKIGGEDLSTETAALTKVQMFTEQSNVSDYETIEFDFGSGQTYFLLVSDRNISVYKQGVFQVNIPSDYLEADLEEIEYTQSSDTIVLFHENYQTRKIVRGSQDDIWDQSLVVYEVIPKHAFTPVVEEPSATLTPSAISGTIKLTASAAVFASSDVGGVITGNGGEARIIEFVSTTVLEARVLINFIDTTAISASSWDIERGYEDAWSDERGWPRTGIFHQRRLAVGGSTQLPNFLWLSRIGRFFNFDEGSGLDNEALNMPIDTDQVNTIKHLMSADRLEVFTSDAEFYVAGNPLTPENSSIRRQDKRGISNVPPVFVDGATMFVQNSADIIREYVFDAISEKYAANNISLISEHLINSPVDIAHQRPYGNQDADLVFVVNSDGTWAVLNTLRQQELTGWVKGFSDYGNLEKVGYDGGKMYGVTAITVDGVDKKYLVSFDPDRRLDWSVVLSDVSLQTVWSGLDHLEGFEVHVIADGYIEEGTFTVTGGSITINRPSYEVQIGIFYSPSVKPNPPERELPDGTMIGETRRILKTSLELRNSLGVIVGGRKISFRRFGQDIFDEPLEPFTGVKEIRHLGYNKEPQNEITQDEPLPFELLSLIQGVSA